MCRCEQCFLSVNILWAEPLEVIQCVGQSAWMFWALWQPSAAMTEQMEIFIKWKTE